MPGTMPCRKATYKLRGHNNGLWYWPIGPRSVPDHYEGTIARETIVNVVNYNCGEIQQQPRFEAQLRSFLPQITSAFGANKSVLVTIDELKKQQQSSDATDRLCRMILLKVCGQFWWARIRIRSGTRQSKREVNQSEVEALFEPLSPNFEELSM
ncbi:hypothetical protein ACFX12_026360 [Malus domestica]